MTDANQSSTRSEIAGRLGEKHLRELLGVVEDDTSTLGNEVKTFDQYRNTVKLKAKQLFRKAGALFWLVRYDRGRIRYRDARGYSQSKFAYGTAAAFTKNPVEVFVLLGEHLLDAIVGLGTVLERREPHDRSTFGHLYYSLPFARAFDRWEPWREGVVRHPGIDPADLESSLPRNPNLPDATDPDIPF